MYKYSIKEPNEDKNLAVILKENVTVEFTLNDMESSRKRAEKVLEEMIALKGLREAEAKNIENNHPTVVEEFEKKDLLFRAQTLALYADKKQNIVELTEKIAEIEKAIEEHDEEVEEIKKQLDV